MCIQKEVFPDGERGMRVAGFPLLIEWTVINLPLQIFPTHFFTFSDLKEERGEGEGATPLKDHINVQVHLDASYF